ncbi:hypothetical protein [Ralstonia sp. ASV6]|uniref:hypothetical protein n=1 Tax=Ralstonia sp. ASV6 TaxID=2795124 RepID=UPI0018EA8715|nr:hypothetical protein [Ralstonia sp. ASV6]
MDQNQAKQTTPTGDGYTRRYLQRIQLVGIGPIPVGSIFLLVLLYVVPLVFVWNAIDYLPRWFDKVALLCLAIYAYGVHQGRKDRA